MEVGGHTGFSLYHMFVMTAGMLKMGDFGLGIIRILKMIALLVAENLAFTL
jgi:hypothetical protein